MDFPKNYNPIKQTKHKTEWQELSKELTDYFKVNCYWIPWKFEMWKIRDKFKQLKELPKEKQNFKFFLGMIRK